MIYLELLHSQIRGAFYLSAGVTTAYQYWANRSVLLDYRPADCVATSASNTGRFVMTAKNGKPCIKCGSNEWAKGGYCLPCHRVSKSRWQKDNLEKAAEYNRRWAEKNLEKNTSRYREWRANNPEKDAAKKRRWKEKYPEKVTAQASRHRTRKTKAGGSYTAAEWLALVEHYGGRCLCCGRADVKLHADHIVPVAKGGTSNIDNIQPLCTSCNCRKQDKTIDYRPQEAAHVTPG